MTFLLCQSCNNHLPNSEFTDKLISKLAITTSPASFVATIAQIGFSHEKSSTKASICIPLGTSTLVY